MKKFVDTAEIKVNAGNGGDGKVSFKRERHVAKGGPDGGDGGRGGNVYFVVNPNMATLLDFRSTSSYKAQNGAPGGSKKMSGANGEDLIINVPAGTLIYEIGDKKDTLIADLTEKNQKILVCAGGIGGRGNFQFRSSINQTPTQFTPGTKGEEKRIRLEIKLLADVGLVGLPNAGKSTLINHLTNAKARVAEYPFTTLNPNLGVCKLKNNQKVIVADVPGLIEGASEGKGLGDEFLRHVERTRLIVHLIDVFSPKEGEDMVKVALKSYKIIRNELKNYKTDLSNKKEIVVINKIDITEVKNGLESIKNTFKKEKIDVLGISAITGEGVDFLINKITEEIEKVPSTPQFETKTPTKVYNIGDLPNKRIVFRGNKTITLEKKLR